jgi:site-specific recombinase XerD
VSSYYAHACRRGVLAGNPAVHVARPEVDAQHSETSELTEDEARRLIGAGELLAEQATTNRSRVAAVRDAAMVVVMLCTGGRVSEVTGALVEDLGHTRGHRVLYVTRKGGKRQALPLGEAARVVDRYINDSGRAAGPLFVTNRGGRVDRHRVFRAVRKAALAADLPAGLRLSPHGLRHTFATMSFDHGAELYDVQDAMGHRNASTTQRYDRGRGRIDRSPVHMVSRVLLGGPEPPVV